LGCFRIGHQPVTETVKNHGALRLNHPEIIPRVFGSVVFARFVQNL
jgi:hypothetical protein